MLLNKSEAMFDCGASTVNELAKYLNRRPERVREWIGQRKYTPPGDVALQIQAWAAGVSTRIAGGTRKLQQAYRASYKTITEARSRQRVD